MHSAHRPWTSVESRAGPSLVSVLSGPSRLAPAPVIPSRTSRIPSPPSLYSLDIDTGGQLRRTPLSSAGQLRKQLAHACDSYRNARGRFPPKGVHHAPFTGWDRDLLARSPFSYYLHKFRKIQCQYLISTISSTGINSHMTFGCFLRRFMKKVKI